MEADASGPLEKPRPAKHRSWEDYLLPAIALALILAGAGRFLWTWKFSPRDTIWILVDIPIAAASLALCDFLRFQTRLPLWLFAILLLAAAIVSAHFSIGLGIILAGLWIFNTMH